jgi:hypothetical protein
MFMKRFVVFIPEAWKHWHVLAVVLLGMTVVLLCQVHGVSLHQQHAAPSHGEVSSSCTSAVLSTGAMFMLVLLWWLTVEPCVQYPAVLTSLPFRPPRSIVSVFPPILRGIV